MNIAFFMQPKVQVAYLYNDFTVRQALEKMKHHGYSAIPVLDREGHYVGTASEGDFLWLIVKGEAGEPHTMAIEDLESMSVKQLELDPAKNPTVSITAGIEELLTRAMNQNFIPVVDDRNLFIGIVTRKDVIKHFYNQAFPGDEFDETK